MRRIDQSSRLVTVGNDYLADYARRAGAKLVEVIPTVIDLERYPMRHEFPENEVLTIGWIGSPSTAKYVEQIAPALKTVCANGKARVMLIGSGKVNLPGVPFEVIHWSEEDEVSQLQQLDVGIMPLPNNPWERGKCGIKLIQYMACGLPVIASPVGVNTEIVGDGKNGYLASSQSEWISALNQLRDNVEQRRIMGIHGRTKVENQYSLQVSGPRLAKILRDLPRSSAVDY